MKIADIIIPHHDRHDHLYECLKTLPIDLFNIHIISGGSFAHNCNKGAKIAETDNLIFLNDDTIPDKDILIEMCKKEADIVGAAQVIPSLQKTYYGILFKRVGEKIRVVFSQNSNELSIPNGFLFHVKRKAWEELGGLDEGFINGGEDSDFGLRALEKGLTIDYVFTPTTHKHSQSKDRLKFHVENKNRLKEKWSDKKIIDLLKLEESPLNILVATNHLDRLGGSETWTYTMVKELERLGHNVEVFTLSKGIVSEKLNTVETPKEEYDLIIMNHNTTMNALIDVRGRKIYTQHGAYCGIEHAKKGCHNYVAISDEVIEKNREIEFTKILNGIDCERFRPKNEIGELKKVLCMCQGEQAQKIAREACEKLNLEIEFIERNIWNVEDKINDAQLVISLGRGAYESMACGRAVIVFDKRAYINKSPFGDGIVEDWEELVKFNFSGRRYNKAMGVNELVDEIKKYKPEMGNINREIALKHFNIKDKVKEYLKLYEQSL